MWCAMSDTQGKTHKQVPRAQTVHAHFCARTNNVVWKRISAGLDLLENKTREETNKSAKPSADLFARSIALLDQLAKLLYIMLYNGKTTARSTSAT
jgi:hypothetical protein